MADTARIAALEAELNELRGERRKEITILIAEKIEMIHKLVKECETLATEGKVDFTIAIGDDYYGQTFDGTRDDGYSGWDTSRC